MRRQLRLVRQRGRSGPDRQRRQRRQRDAVEHGLLDGVRHRTRPPRTRAREQTQAGSPCGCGGLGVQALGQEAFTGQLSKALSSAWQIGAKNASDPVRVWSFGGGGTTGQANGANSQASAPNIAGTGQNASQAMIGAPIKI